jgi:hypothetical protein
VREMKGLVMRAHNAEKRLHKTEKRLDEAEKRLRDLDEDGEDEDSKDVEECCVCMDNPTNARFEPCQHRVCMTCGPKVRAGGCPTCRGVIAGITEG